MFDKRIVTIVAYSLLSSAMNQSTDPCTLSIFQTCETCQIQEKIIKLEKCGEIKCKDGNEDDWVENTGGKFHEELRKITQIKQKVKTLIIKSVFLESVPSSVCELSDVKEIYLENNCLMSIPSNCFNKLTKLKKLTITQNRIKSLQAGLFDGLNNLNYLNLTSNLIEDIDDALFKNENDLLSLKVLDLQGNRLVTVDAWIIIRGIAVWGSLIDLRNNEIASLSNKNSFQFTCSDAAPKPDFNFFLGLSFNNLKHITDLLIYFPTDIDFLCLFGKKDSSSVKIELYGMPQNCDCESFKIVQVVHMFAYNNFLDEVHCWEPVALRHQKLISLKLSELVCVHDEFCPNFCKCSEVPFYRMYFVDCSKSKKFVLPSVINVNTTAFPSAAYWLSLNFSGNFIKEFTFRKYLKLAKVLDFSDNLIEQIDENLFTNVTNLEELYLHSNQITTIPRDFLTNSSFRLRILSLHNNSWDCSCINGWLKNWMLNLKNKSINLLNPSSILCNSPLEHRGRNIFSVTDEEFCRNINESKINFMLSILLIPTFIVIFITMIVYQIVRKFKVEINIYWKLHPFDRDECLGENMEYDAFISCAYSDREHGIKLVRLLESKGYRVCYHEKDFIGGQSIAVNIVEAVMYSKRVICFMTTHFINSTYCMFEFQAAFHRNIEIKRKRLIVILTDSLEISKNVLPDDVYNFLTTHTYVKWSPDDKWVGQLLYSMPIKSVDRNDDIGIKFGDKDDTPLISF